MVGAAQLDSLSLSQVASILLPRVSRAHVRARGDARHPPRVLLEGFEAAEVVGEFLVAGVLLVRFRFGGYGDRFGVGDHRLLVVRKLGADRLETGLLDFTQIPR